MQRRHLPCRLIQARASETSMERELEDLGWSLLEAEGALAFQRERAERAECELAVVERALLRLLQAAGSKAADREDVRMGLGLPAVVQAAARPARSSNGHGRADLRPAQEGSR